MEEACIVNLPGLLKCLYKTFFPPPDFQECPVHVVSEYCLRMFQFEV